MSISRRAKSSWSPVVEQRAAYSHIKKNFPFLEPLIQRTGVVPLPNSSEEPVADALVRIVVGQMLSQVAARSIVARMVSAAEAAGCGPLYHLPVSELRACGLSGRKARTISLIAELADQDPNGLEGWRELPFEELRRKVGSIWGLSDWSASILGIFHFAEPDVFPVSDGSLARAIRLVEQQYLLSEERLEHEAASPFSSYLAILLWHALDNGHLVEGESKPPTKRRR